MNKNVNVTYDDGVAYPGKVTEDHFDGTVTVTFDDSNYPPDKVETSSCALID